MEDSLGMMGCKVTVVALSPSREGYVPVEEATLYSLFPDYEYRNGRFMRDEPELRVARIKLSVEGSKVVGRCDRWWSIGRLRAELRSKSKRSKMPVQAARLLSRVTKASVFGRDLPFFFADTSDGIRSLDYGILELDVFRGMNGVFPFQYKLTAELEERIKDELPFCDLREHFASLMPDTAVLSLMRQLVRAYSRQVRGMTLTPLRWISSLDSSDTVAVKVCEPVSVVLPDAKDLCLRVGALSVELARPLK